MKFFAYPLHGVFRSAFLAPALLSIPVLGGLLWFCYGFTLQSLRSLRSPGGPRRSGFGVLGIGLIWLLPWVSLKSLPEWEEQWEQGTAAANDREVDKAIRHVSGALRSSPADNPMLGGMWDYLGRLHMDRNEFAPAEAAFTKSLAFYASQPDPSPSYLLGSYNELASCCQRSGERARRREYLKKAIEYNRIVYGRDSIQEAACWSDLAEIAHAEENSAEAKTLMDRSVRMESDVSGPDSSSVNYRRDLLRQWSGK